MLGRGGFGVVYLAEDGHLRRLVALKIPRAETLFTPGLRQRFLLEAQATARLSHPYILPVFEPGEVGPFSFLVEAYCAGGSLADWLSQRTTPLSPRHAAQLLAAVASAVQHAHEHGVLHRDLKPANILLEPLGEGKVGLFEGFPFRPRVGDFGLAKFFDLVEEETSLSTESVAESEPQMSTLALLGTPAYMAPEQAANRRAEIGVATDVYGLGALLYELLTRRPPIQGANTRDTLRRIESEEPPLLRRFRLGVPRDLEAICHKCLMKAPAQRYPSVQTLAEDLRRFLDGRPIQARRVGWAVRTVKWARRRPRALALCALTSGLFCSLLAVLIWIGSRESARSADLTNALQEIGSQKALAEKQDWLARNHKYAAQIRSGAILNTTGEPAKLREVLSAQIPSLNQKDVRGFEWHYLWRCEGFMLPEHKALVTALAYSGNGKIIASGNANGDVDLFDRRTGATLARLQGHTYLVNRLHFLKDDTQLLSLAFGASPKAAEFHGEFILWSLGAEKKVLRRGAYSHSWRAFGHPMFALAPAARTLFVIDRDSKQHRLLTLDLETGAERVLLTSDRLSLVAATPHADRLAVVSYNPGRYGKQGAYSLEIIDPATMKQVCAQQFDKPVHMAEFSPDGSTLALAVGWFDKDRFVEIRESPSLRLLRSLECALLPQGLRFDRQGNRLAVAIGQTYFNLFNVQTGNSLGSFKHEGAMVMALAFYPDGEELAVGTRDGRVRTGRNVFDLQDHSLPGPLPKSEAWCLAFSPDGTTLAAGYDHANSLEHQTLQLWDIATRKAKPLTGHVATVMALAVSPDGKTLASASYDHTVRLWDLEAGKCLHELRGHTDAVRALAISPDGRRLASAGSDLVIKMWNVNDGSLQDNWQGHSDAIRALAFSPDGKLLISAANDRTIKIWNAAEGTSLRTITDESKVQCVACSPDGALLASGNENNQVELWQLATGELWKTLPGHMGKVRSVAFSPDGKTLASGGEDKSVRLWNVVTGQELLVLPTEHFVDGLAFNPRKPILAAALHDGTVKLWSGE